MAVDESLYEGVRQGGGPFVRFYTWNPYTLSLGRFQNLSDGLSAYAQDLPRVRRLTGGGAIWHGDELTYSLGCHQNDLGSLNVKKSLEKLCGFLLASWRSFGWKADFARDSAAQSGDQGSFTPACFAGQEEYDILVNGRKLGGNAQKRDRLTIFQQGSIPLALDWKQLENSFLPGFRPHQDITTDLKSCGWEGQVNQLTDVLAFHLGEQLSSSLQPAELTPEEVQQALAAERERYGRDEWTEYGSGKLRSVETSVGGPRS